MYFLKLYVLGWTPKSEAMVSSLREFLDQKCKEDYSLQVVDLLQDPQSAEDDRVFATPMLIKDVPAPVRRVFGDLSDGEQVWFGLGLRPPNEDRGAGLEN